MSALYRLVAGALAVSSCSESLVESSLLGAQSPGVSVLESVSWSLCSGVCDLKLVFVSSSFDSKLCFAGRVCGIADCPSLLATSPDAFHRGSSSPALCSSAALGLSAQLLGSPVLRQPCSSAARNLCFRKRCFESTSKSLRRISSLRSASRTSGFELCGPAFSVARLSRLQWLDFEISGAMSGPSFQIRAPDLVPAFHSVDELRSLNPAFDSSLQAPALYSAFNSGSLFRLDIPADTSEMGRPSVWNRRSERLSLKARDTLPEMI